MHVYVRTFISQLSLWICSTGSIELAKMCKHFLMSRHDTGQCSPERAGRELVREQRVASQGQWLIRNLVSQVWRTENNFSNVAYCSETTLTGGSRFHISTPPGFEPGYLMTGSKRVVHWTSETWWEWSEIAGSAQYFNCERNSYFVLSSLMKVYSGW
jgi:hypothetical protein